MRTENDRAEARNRAEALLSGVVGVDAAAIERCRDLAREAGETSHRMRHLAFVGVNTYMATLARAVAELYFAAGVLPIPRARITEVAAQALLSEADRQDEALMRRGRGSFMDRALNPSAIRDQVQAADGGLLYVHDFEQLTPASCRKIAAELVPEMEYRRTLGVVIAGSHERIDDMVSTVPGLSPRVTRIEFW